MVYNYGSNQYTYLDSNMPPVDNNGSQEWIVPANTGAGIYRMGVSENYGTDYYNTTTVSNAITIQYPGSYSPCVVFGTPNSDVTGIGVSLQFLKLSYFRSVFQCTHKSHWRFC